MKRFFSVLVVVFALINFIYSDSSAEFKKIYSANKDKVIRIKTSESVGSGFIAKNGFIITANHVIGTSVSIEMVYNNVNYYLKPCYRDRANDIAILYPYAYEDNFGSLEKIPYDFFKGKSHLTIKNITVKKNDNVMVLGYPYSLLELKRILGKFKEEKNRYMENVPLYACDLAVIKGCSGGPVFKANGDIIGIAVMYEKKPTATEYLVSYVSPVKNIITMINNITPKYMKKIREASESVPSFSIDSDNLQKIDSDYLSDKNIKYVEKEDSLFLISKDNTGYLSYSKQTKAANVFFNLFLSPISSYSKPKTSEFNIYIKKIDEQNYISFRIDMTKNAYTFVYMVNGKKTIKKAFIEMPVIEENLYNFEVYTIENRMGVYFDNIAIYYDDNLPFNKGGSGFNFEGIGCIIQDYNLRIPYSYE